MTSTKKSHYTLEASERPFVEILRTTPVETICPNFYALDHARGCAFTPLCTYCYLKDPYYQGGKTSAATNVNELEQELCVWLRQDTLETYVANAGNLSDSLAFEELRPLMGRLVELFRREAEQKGRPHTLLLVTKGGVKECTPLLEREPCASVMVSFSINSEEAQHELEQGAATTADRLEAASLLKEKGWRMRIRLDPMIAGYDYCVVADEIGRLRPERVTLGTLRADPGLMPVLPPHLKELLVPAPEYKGKYALARYPFDLRLGIYRQAADRLRDVCSLGLCEETPDMWRALGFDWRNASCNCEGHPGHHEGFVPKRPGESGSGQGDF
jgi:DNA repair photolyase